jgi:methionine-rich copper-binding protein CopC
MKISNREIIIAAVAILVLLGIGYFINNNNSEDGSSNNQQEEQVDLDENGESDGTEEEEEATPEGVISTEPAKDAEVALASAPTAVVLKTDKEMAAGSEIKVVSDKNIDVVTAGNRLTADLKQLSAPVALTAPGTYTVNYTINWKDGSKSDGNYKFTVK